MTGEGSLPRCVWGSGLGWEGAFLQKRCLPRDSSVPGYSIPLLDIALGNAAINHGSNLYYKLVSLTLL